MLQCLDSKLSNTSPILLFAESLRILAVPQNLLGEDLVGYKVSSDSFDFIFQNICCTFDSNDFVGSFTI